MTQELKDYDIMDVEAMDDARLEESPTGRIFVSRVYLKSEADKVLLHHARKRCLAMRHYCASRFSEWCTERRKKADFYWKWKEIWLSLAAEPTWDRFLKLIHKEAK